MHPDRWLAYVMLLAAGSALAQPSTDRALDAVRAKLRDPASAVFESVAAGRNDKLQANRAGVCGYVNAKNGYGGYAGRQRFAVYLTDEGAPEAVTFANDFASRTLVDASCTLWGLQ